MNNSSPLYLTHYFYFAEHLKTWCKNRSEEQDLVNNHRTPLFRKKISRTVDYSLSLSLLGLLYVLSGINPVPAMPHPLQIISIETENYSTKINRRGYAWIPTAKHGYSGDGAMMAAPEDKVRIKSKYKYRSPQLDYRFNVASPGKYFVWIRAYGVNRNSDSIHIGTNGKPIRKGRDISIPVTGNYAWTDGKKTPIAIRRAGDYVLNVWMSESGTIIDKIVLTSDSGFVPTGTGPDETPVDNTSGGSNGGSGSDSGGDSGGDSSGDSMSSPTHLPTVTGQCPEFHQGDITFSPKGIKQRQASIWIGPEAQEKDGPLVFYWHGTGMSPSDAIWSIGNRNIKEIKSMGGIVVAPHSDPSQPYEWFIANGSNRLDDVLVTDEIVACAIEKIGIDTRRIHSTGMSAGGMITSDLALRRANYFASTSPKSGGFSPWNPIPKNAEPDNKSAAMIFHGGEGDRWGSSLKYKPISEKFRDKINKNGGFAFICDHGRGHTVPTDAVDAVWQFFKDHPWIASPSPYKQGLPADFPRYCKIP